MATNGRGRCLWTSVSVTEGHHDKLCDQVSDAILDAILEQDPRARVACETVTTTGMVFIMGEITTTARVDYAAVARRTIADIGYTNPAYGLDAATCAVLVAIDEQSPDISQGVSLALEARQAGGAAAGDVGAIGAGDQGMMFGYASDETPEMMPLPIALAHRLARRLAQVRREKILPYLRPDGKTQVTVEYDGDEAVGLDAIVVSAQHDPDVDNERLHRDIVEHVIRPVVPAHLWHGGTRIMINPTGRFVVGGPQGDSGLTGRKIIVDTYGGIARHGGGAFSGKDPTKVDRSASYACRYVAKNVVAAGLARKCEVHVAYVIGVAQPVSITVDTRGTGRIPDEDIARIVQECFDLRPGAIIRDLDLQRPIYRQVAAYGHFGRTDLDLPWERTDRVDDLRRAAGISGGGERASAPRGRGGLDVVEG